MAGYYRRFIEGF
jgi:hypothetical protein